MNPAFDIFTSQYPRKVSLSIKFPFDLRGIRNNCEMNLYQNWLGFKNQIILLIASLRTYKYLSICCG